MIETQNQTANMPIACQSYRRSRNESSDFSMFNLHDVSRNGARRYRLVPTSWCDHVLNIATVQIQLQTSVRWKKIGAFQRWMHVKAVYKQAY